MSQWSNCSSDILVRFGPGLLTCVDLFSVTTVTCIRVPSHDSQLEVSPYQVYGLSPLPPALRFENQFSGEGAGFVKGALFLEAVGFGGLGKGQNAVDAGFEFAGG